MDRWAGEEGRGVSVDPVIVPCLEIGGEGVSGLPARHLEDRAFFRAGADDHPLRGAESGLVDTGAERASGNRVARHLKEPSDERYSPGDGVADIKAVRLAPWSRDFVFGIEGKGEEEFGDPVFPRRVACRKDTGRAFPEEFKKRSVGAELVR